MKLTRNGIQNSLAFSNAKITLPAYDVEASVKKAAASPRWVHFGIGNIFRIFIGTIADDLLALEDLDRGITCIETFDFEVVDKIYHPYDNLALCVTLDKDGTNSRRVIGSLSEALALRPDDAAAWNRAMDIFSCSDLQMVSFTITEKGYELRQPDGSFLPFIQKDLAHGPNAGGLHSAMSVLTALLIHRFKTVKTPLALVSMDNVSQNGAKLRQSVLEIARTWQNNGFVESDFVAWVEDESCVSFPWTMIDKITPRPSENVAQSLKDLGIEDMDIVVTEKKTYIAPFVNAECPQYLVIEDNFPNGRPPLEKAGVYMTDRETVNASERMKVTVCLNPIHSALGPYGVVLGISEFWKVMQDTDLLALANLVGPVEGMDVVIDPKIISPKNFLNEVLTERFPNPYLPDTVQRLCTDISQGLSVRFGVTTAAYVKKYGDASRLLGIPLAIAGWLRYLIGVEDDGRTTYELSPDPLNDELTSRLSTVTFGHPESVADHLQPILSNKKLFGLDLYAAGIGKKIEDLFREEISGPGAVRAVLQRELYKR